jgi:hypothetical protein
MAAASLVEGLVVFAYGFDPAFPRWDLWVVALAFPAAAGFAIFRPAFGKTPEADNEAAHFRGRARWSGMWLATMWLVGPLLLSTPKAHFSIGLCLLAAIFGSCGVAVGWALRPTEFVVREDGVSLFTNGKREWSFAWQEVATIRKGGSVIVGPKGAPAQQPWIDFECRDGRSGRILGERLPRGVFERALTQMRAEARKRPHMKWIET